MRAHLQESLQRGSDTSWGGEGGRDPLSARSTRRVPIRRVSVAQNATQLLCPAMHGLQARHDRVWTDEAIHDPPHGARPPFSGIRMLVGHNGSTGNAKLLAIVFMRYDSVDGEAKRLLDAQRASTQEAPPCRVRTHKLAGVLKSELLEQEEIRELDRHCRIRTSGGKIAKRLGDRHAGREIQPAMIAKPREALDGRLRRRMSLHPIRADGARKHRRIWTMIGHPRQKSTESAISILERPHPAMGEDANQTVHDFPIRHGGDGFRGLRQYETGRALWENGHQSPRRALGLDGTNVRMANGIPCQPCFSTLTAQ